MHQPTDQNVGQRIGVPGQYLDIVLVIGQYPDITRVAGQYKIHCPSMAFDLPMQSVS